MAKIRDIFLLVMTFAFHSKIALSLAFNESSVYSFIIYAMQSGVAKTDFQGKNGTFVLIYSPEGDLPAGELKVSGIKTIVSGNYTDIERNLIIKCFRDLKVSLDGSLWIESLDGNFPHSSFPKDFDQIPLISAKTLRNIIRDIKGNKFNIHHFLEIGDGYKEGFTLFAEQTDKLIKDLGEKGWKYSPYKSFSNGKYQGVFEKRVGKLYVAIEEQYLSKFKKEFKVFISSSVSVQYSYSLIETVRNYRGKNAKVLRVDSPHSNYGWIGLKVENGRFEKIELVLTTDDVEETLSIDLLPQFIYKRDPYYSLKQKLKMGFNGIVGVGVISALTYILFKK